MAIVWFITGSSRGLGKAIVEHALQTGDSVVATARTPKDLKHLVDRYGEDRVLTLALDVTNYEAAEQATQAAIKKFGRVDILVNNAGYSDMSSVEDVHIDVLRKQIDTNLYGVVNVTKAFLPVLRIQGGGHIFQIASIGSRVGTPAFAAYQAAKWGVSGFSTALSSEVAPLGIKITVLEPGAMATDFADPSSMTVHPFSDAYKPTVGAMLAHVERAQKGAVTSLETVGRVISRLFREPQPPVRLVLGQDAFEYAQKVAQDLKESDEHWKELSVTEL